jgi:hypothetical protein
MCAGLHIACLTQQQQQQEEHVATGAQRVTATEAQWYDCFCNATAAQREQGTA